MIQYIIKRILIFIPTLIVISLLTFVISLNAPGDPVEQMLSTGGQEGQIADKLSTEKAYLELKHTLGLDLPVFYFSFTNTASCDTLYKIHKSRHRKALERLIDIHGNWPLISIFHHKAKEFENRLFQIYKDQTNADRLIKSKEIINNILSSYESKKITDNLKLLDNIAASHISFVYLRDDIVELSNAFENVLTNPTVYKRYIPVIRFYGFNNQYHNWITKFMVGDFGISYQDKRPVSSVIWDAIGWTMLISVLSMLIAYIVAIPLGVISAVNKGERLDKSISAALFMLYSLPSFWVATMLIIFFGSPEYLQMFPVFGLSSIPSDAPFLARFGDTAYHLVLPLFCWTYTSFAFLSRQMRGGMLSVTRQDYIRTARAKGVAEKNVIWKHAFRNSLIPIITLFASVFPLAIGGSVILEMIFSIPGMGKISFMAITARNYPIIFTVLMFGAVLTLIGYLVSDILYALVDPRISFSNKKN